MVKNIFLAVARKIFRPDLVYIFLLKKYDCGLQVPDASEAVHSLSRTRYKIARQRRRAILYLVAGPGLAPGSPGYEPDEVLLLYPAIHQIAC